MSETRAARLGPEERPHVPASASAPAAPASHAWQGPTYYGRPQLKPPVFNDWIVGGYIFLAGLSGASAQIVAIARWAERERPAGLVRRGRYLSLLASTLGPVLLIVDLHTPQRFYNMLRVAKRTSPMSIGTWILMSFSAFAGASAAGQFLADRFPRRRWLETGADIAQLPAALTGAGLSTYTAALLSATSTPSWAAAPRALAVRFGASSVASGAAALALMETTPPTRRRLETLAVAALGLELAATGAERRARREKGIAEVERSAWGRTETLLATGLGVALPLGLYAAARLRARGSRPRGGRLPDGALAAILAGSAMLRIATLGLGKESAKRPEISLRFSQPDNLPAAERRGRIGARG